MNESNISRRDFLRQFVVLSALSVAGAGCRPRPVPVYGIEATPQPLYGVIEVTIVPEYGVEPVDLTHVLSMTYPKDGNEHRLDGAQSVPVDASFTIRFSAPMDPATRDALALQDATGGSVPFGARWLDETTLQVTPSRPLQPATVHFLEVGEAARTTAGRPLDLAEGAFCRFTTAE